MATTQPILTNEDYHRFIAWYKRNKDKPYWWSSAFYVGLILCGTGLRSSEARTLRLDQCVLHPIPMVLVRNGKGGKDRDVAVLPQFRPYFVERVRWLHRQQKRFKKRRIEWVFVQQGKNHEWVKLFGKPVSPRTARYWWDWVIEAAGIEKLKGQGAHQGRRSWATYVARLTWTGADGAKHRISPVDLAEQLGHSNVSTTNEYYIASPVGMRFPSDQAITWAEELEDETT